MYVYVRTYVRTHYCYILKQCHFQVQCNCLLRNRFSSQRLVRKCSLHKQKQRKLASHAFTHSHFRLSTPVCTLHNAFTHVIKVLEWWSLMWAWLITVHGTGDSTYSILHNIITWVIAECQWDSNSWNCYTHILCMYIEQDVLPVIRYIYRECSRVTGKPQLDTHLSACTSSRDHFFMHN